MIQQPHQQYNNRYNNNGYNNFHIGGYLNDMHPMHLFGNNNTQQRHELNSYLTENSNNQH